MVVGELVLVVGEDVTRVESEAGRSWVVVVSVEDGSFELAVMVVVGVVGIEGELVKGDLGEISDGGMEL